MKYEKPELISLNVRLSSSGLCSFGTGDSESCGDGAAASFDCASGDSPADNCGNGTGDV
jgi:hypothetical protein